MANIIISPLWCAPFSGMHPIWRALYFLTACTGFLKMLSYHHIWHDVRYHVILANKILEEKETEEKSDDAKSKNKKLSADVNNKNSDDVKEYSNGILFVDRSLSIDTLVTKLNIPKHTVKELVMYPANVTPKDLFMFILIPTLVFQLAYPLSNKRNYIKFVLKIIVYILLQMLWVTIIMEY